MNFRLTAALFSVVLVLVVGLLVAAVTTTDPSFVSEGPFAALTAAGVVPTDVTEVEIARTSPKDEKLVFTKAGGRWSLTYPTPAGADSKALDEFVRNLLDLKPVEYGGPVERSGAGLSRPEVTVTLRAGDRSAAVDVGLTSSGKEQAVTFLAPAGNPNALPMAVPTRTLRNGLFRQDANNGLPATMVKWRSDFRPRALFAGEFRDTAADAQAVTLVRGKKTLSLTGADGEWRFVTPELGRADVNGASTPDPIRMTGVRPLLNAILFLQTANSADVTEDVPVEDLGKVGLASTDNPLRVTVTPKGKPAQTLLVGNRVTDKEGKPLAPARYFVKLEGDAAVFTVTTNTVDQLVNTLNDPTSLQNRDLLPSSKLAQIDAIDSTFGGGFKLRKLSGGIDPWGVYGGGGEPVEAQMQAVQMMLSRLATPRVATDVLAKTDDAAFAGDSLQAKLKVWFAGVDKAKAKLSDGKLPPEPPVTGDPVELWIGKQSIKNVSRPDGTIEERKSVVVRRITGKETADLEVPLDAVALALQSRVKFINARVPTFVQAQATGLVLFRDGKRTEYVKSTTRDPAYPRGLWNAGDAKGAVADGDGIFDLLGKLASMSPTILMEKADDLKALGLDPANPKLGAKVTLQDEKGPRTEEFQFGEPVKGDDKSVYFKTLDKPFVYAVSAELMTRLRTADLSDKVAFRLNPSRVKKVRLRGWPATTADKTPALVEAELQSGTWVALEPKGANLDAGLLNLWVGVLQYPKIVGPAPVEQGKEPPAAYGFGLDAIKMLVFLRGEKEGDPDVGFDLTLGATTADQTGIYARLSDGRCFLLDAKPFLPLLPRPPLAAR